MGVVRKRGLMADPANEAVPAPVAVAAKRKFRLPIPQPGTHEHFVFCREGSGGLLALELLVTWLAAINPTGALGMYVFMWLAFANGIWYIWAQLGGVKFAGKESSNNDDKAVPRDARWSRYPMHAIHIMGGLSVIAWGLKTFTHVFQDSIPMWVADHLIMSWAYVGVVALYYAIIMIDINTDAEIVAILRRFIGSRTRVNE